MPPTFHFVLASTSPRRRELLEILGIPFVVVSPGSASERGEINETPLSNESPADLVQRLSLAKALAVVNNLPQLFPLLGEDELFHSVVIAADTVVALEDKILGKPNTPTEATQMLKLLRRQPHHVYSGLTVASPALSHQPKTQNSITYLHQSKVWMRPYTDAEMTAYVSSGSPLDKAGAYGIQDQPFAPVERLEGCFASVMGLPLAKLATAFEEINISLPEISRGCTRFTGSVCCQIASNQSRPLT
jgi:MAF protein